MKQKHLDNLMGIVGNIFEAYSVALFLPSEDGRFVLNAWFSLGDDIANDTTIEPGQGLVGWIIRNQQPLLVTNFDQKQSFLGYYRKGGEDHIKTFLGCPVPLIGGALCIDSEKTYSFSDKEQKILNQFSCLISSLCKDTGEIAFSEKEAILLQCMQIIPQLRERFPKWSVFLKHFLDLLSESTGFPFCMLTVRDEWGQGYYLEGWNVQGFLDPSAMHDKFKIGSGVIGWAFKNQRPVFSEDSAASSEGLVLFAKDQGPLMKTVICLPLIVNRRTRGVLVFADISRHVLDPTLKKFALTVADYLALFLENLYLKNRLHRQKRSGK
ncbi:MAG: GAF domain-containing protein [Desulfoplanes sp.]|nr:GAF domain-containing protein [Desulfoplanes sp.]